jgi:AraC-like DNA-binding protein
MPSSAVRTFTDADDYAEAIKGGQIELTVTERGRFTGELTRVHFHRLWMQRFSENRPWVCHVTLMPARAYIQFPTAPRPSLNAGGLEILPTNIIRHRLADDFYQRASDATSHAAMSLPLEDLVTVGAATAGVDLTPPRDPSLITPLPSAMTKLQRLHAAAAYLAEFAPEIIAHPEASRGLEQALIETMVDCLAGREARENTLAQGQHAIVMHRFRRVVDENPEHPLYIPEICKAVGISSRTLQACCHEHLGMGPKHYLLLRRMNLARRALRQEAPETTSVTEIATRYGFWQLGRFAVEYQSLFGESPSATLARQFA